MTQREDKNKHHQSRPKLMMPAADWLYTATPMSASRANHKAMIDRPGDDRFLSFGLALKQKGDPAQESAFTKFYLFMHDCLPSGLVGPYAHIHGDDVMRVLLCHKESTPSRHTVARQAEAAFTKLEVWIARGKNWREAQRRIETEKGKPTGSRKRGSTRAPGLCSASGMLAILILAHPDDGKFKNWIVHKL